MMRRRRPQMSPRWTAVTLLLSATALLMKPCVSGEISAVKIKRELHEIWTWNDTAKSDEFLQQATVPEEKTPPEEDVTPSPSGSSSCGQRDGCPCGGCPTPPTDPEPVPPPPTDPPLSIPTEPPAESPIAPEPTWIPPSMFPMASSPAPTNWPTVTPSEASIVPATPAPVVPETPAPVVPEIPPSIVPETSAPDLPETPAPVITETPAPIALETPVPTAAPVTPRPTQIPTFGPPVDQPVQPTLPNLTDPPTAERIVVPFAPFVFTLAIADAQAATRSDDPEAIAMEIDRILSDFLYDKLSDYDFGDGVSLNNVNLSVVPQIRRLTSNIFGGRRQLLRSLQVQTIGFDVSGSTDFDVVPGTPIDEQQLTQEVSSAAQDISEDPQNQQELIEEFRASDNRVLSQTVAASAELQTPPNDSTSTPTTVAVIFGFVLAGLGAVGLGIYCHVFLKKRRKRALQRKRERAGQYDAYNAVGTTQSTSSANNSMRSPESSKDKPSGTRVMVLPPTELEAESSSQGSSSASYQGVGSESSGSQSDFTRELELAASLDRRAWIDMQKQREATARKVHSFGDSPMNYPSQYSTTAPGDEGFEVQNVSAGGPRAVNISSFPYGDERNGSDEDSVDLSEVKGQDGEDLFDEGEHDLEWAEHGVWSPYDGYQRRTNRSGAEKGWSPIDSVPESRVRGQKDPNAFLKSWSSIDSAPPQDRQRNKTDPSASTKIYSSIDTFPESRERTMSDEAVLLDSVDGEPPKARSVPVARMSSNAVRRSPAVPQQVSKEQGEPAKVEGESNNDSLVTIDIVKEVHRLARFVKRYERKRERKEEKERQRHLQIASGSNEMRSVPSVGYDHLSDSVSALHKGHDSSPRRRRLPLSDAVEESETEESLTAEQSWSTQSNANSAFDDEDEEIPVEDSEGDLSDSSVDDDPSDTDHSRLGITPFSVQKVVGVPNAATKRSFPSPETARPPVTEKSISSKGLSPVPGTPASPDDNSPEKTRTPVQNIKRAMRLVNSARQSSEKSQQARSVSKRPRGSDLTEDALHGISVEGDASLNAASPYQAQKGSLGSLRKNDAILDTASSIITDGVTPSQHENAFEAREKAVHRNPVRSRSSQVPPYNQGRGRPSQRSPQRQDSVDEGRSPSTQPPHGASEERSPPLQGADAPDPGRVLPVPPMGTELRNPPGATPVRSPASEQLPMPPRSAANRPSPYLSPFVQQTTPEVTTTPEKPSAWQASASSEQHSGTKRSSPTAQQSSLSQSGTTSPAPAAGPTSSPELRSPPRRRKKSGAAFNNVISMFEKKPKNAIFPPNENWQYTH